MHAGQVSLPTIVGDPTLTVKLVGGNTSVLLSQDLVDLCVCVTCSGALCYLTDVQYTVREWKFPVCIDPPPPLVPWFPLGRRIHIHTLCLQNLVDPMNWSLSPQH